MSDSNSTMASTGVAGLDDVLSGGFLRARVFLLEGNPGTGKTTIATQLLIATEK
jgi:circadian clock protein KaiC